MSARLGTSQVRLLTLGALLWVSIAAATGCLSDISLPAGCDAGGGCGGETAHGGQVSGAVGDAGDQTGGGSAGDAEAGAADAGTGGVGDAGAPTGAKVCINCLITPPQPPNPCGNDHYSTQLKVSGGTAPYHWQLDSSAAGWQLASNAVDGSKMQLTGDPSGKTRLDFTITDRLGYVLRKSYPLVPRTACYIAYVYPDVNGAKLSLRDPLLDIDATASLVNNAGVHDFRFSPDGRFIAYRYGADATHPSGAHLSLLDFSNLHDAALSLDEDAVTAYAWSPDSKVLAMALTVGGHSELSGVRPTSAATGTVVEPLTAVVAADAIESDLHWVGTQFVGFSSSDTPDVVVPPGLGIQTIFSATFTGQGFAPPLPITDTSYQPGIMTITPAPDGLFVTSPPDYRSVFNAFVVDGSHAIDHGMNLVDPAGMFSAAIVNDTLQLFKATNSDAAFETSDTTAKYNCPKLLTWAHDRERIACVAHVTEGQVSWGEVRIFDVAAATPLELVPAVLGGACLKNQLGDPLGGCSGSEYDYDELSSEAQPRSFSPSGRWLAFTTTAQSGPGALYWSDLTTNPMRLSRSSGTEHRAPGLPSALAFSPSERYLLHQNGNQLLAHLLSAGPQDGQDLHIDEALDASASAPCSDEYFSAPTRWCGGANKSETFIWSPDADVELFAYRKPMRLVVVELSQSTFTPHEFVVPSCIDSCSGQFEFQPPLP